MTVSIASKLGGVGTSLTPSDVGSTVQAYSANLTTLAGFTTSTSASLVENSDTVLATQKAVKSYADALIATADAMIYKGAIDCSSSPNYPTGDSGWTYRVSVGGKIGGASGVVVEVGDFFVCNTDGTASGNQATVGTKWNVIQTNIDGALVSGGALGTPASGTLTNCTADGTNAVGTKNIQQNSQSGAYTTVLADSGKHLLHPSADTTARTFTIDSNANVAYPIGTAITFVNQASAGTLTIAITTDTMRLAGAGTTGNRTLAANGIATALKISSTEWIISGTGLT